MDKPPTDERLDRAPEIEPAAVRFAAVLSCGWRAGFLVLLVTYGIYVSGLAKPLVSMEKLAACWKLSAAEYVAKTGTPTGWGWARVAHQGDMMNFIGIAALGALTIVCLLATVPVYLRTKDNAYAVMALAEAAILAAAAAGLMG